MHDILTFLFPHNVFYVNVMEKARRHEYPTWSWKWITLYNITYTLKAPGDKGATAQSTSFVWSTCWLLSDWHYILKCIISSINQSFFQRIAFFHSNYFKSFFWSKQQSKIQRYSDYYETKKLQILTVETLQPEMFGIFA